MKIKSWILAALMTMAIAAKAATYVVTVTFPEEKVVAYATAAGWKANTVTVGEDGQEVSTPNPVSATEYAKADAGKAFIEYLSRFNVQAVLAQKETEKQAAVTATREAVGAGVSITVQE